MEPELQQQEQINVTLPESMAALKDSEPGTLAILPPTTEPDDQWQPVGTQFSDFLEHLPIYLGTFFQEYKLPVISFGLLVVGVGALRIALAVLDALDDIPLLPPTFELIGIGYTTWFTFRYLLKATTRQELGAEVSSIKEQTLGGNISDSSS